MPFTVDISPNPIRISMGSGSGGGGSSDMPKSYVRLIDHLTGDIRYVYVSNGVLYISDSPPSQ